LDVILERMPADTSARPPFADDPSREVQIASHPAAEAVVILFCGNRLGLGIPRRAMHQRFARLPATLVYLRDFSRRYYCGGLERLGPDRASMVAALRRMGEARRVLCWGNSSGAAAALHCALDLDAECAVAFAGPFNFLPEFNVHLRSARPAARLRKAVP